MNRGATARLSLRTAGIALSLLAGCAVDRVSAAEVDRLAEVLRLEPGMHIADVGAGEGEWTVELASRVGPEGHVWATEVEADEIEAITRRVQRQALENVSVVRGDQSRTGLPVACCDAILLRLVYHHFEQPAAMRASLKRALKASGRVIVIDITPQSGWRDLPEVPDRGGHGIEPVDLIREMADDGFELVERHDHWNGDAERFCLVFVLAPTD